MKTLLLLSLLLVGCSSKKYVYGVYTPTGGAIICEEYNNFIISDKSIDKCHLNGTTVKIYNPTNIIRIEVKE